MNNRIRPVSGLKDFFGISFWQLQLVLLAVGVALGGMFWLIRGDAQFFQNLVFSLVIGNCTTISLQIASPVFIHRPRPWDWFVFIVLLIPVSAISSSLATVIWRLVSGERTGDLLAINRDDIRVGTFVSLIVGVAIYLSFKTRRRLEERNRELESQVTLGRIKLQTQEGELKAAHEIQAHLLPGEIPQIGGLKVSCAWQPASSVGGDYFDVLALPPGRIAVCLADVSGKGITAALLMANLQAAVRAFAPGITDPGALCTKLNEVLCGSIPPGKFVTFFYGVIDNETLTLRYENAGHVYPIVLRGGSATVLKDGGTVLGLFPDAVYEERIFRLQSGDCLLLTTDGVTEAANEHDEQFGEDRVTAAARAAQSLGARGIQARILEDVTLFCQGNFQDDVSLVVVTVE